MREAAARSLKRFAQQQYNTYARSFAGKIDLLMAVALLADSSTKEPQRRQAERVIKRSAEFQAQYDTSRPLGVAMQKYADDYIRENVRPVLNELARQQAKDPDDVSGRNSLRNRAEMEVRYQGHLDNIQRLRDGGNKLVVASTHSDCSERCRPWQGRVYSLDGTSGTTDDGRRYVPLEDATDVWYTTKAGKRYKNGLLGFNCRHYLTPYRSGVKPLKVSEAERARQDAISQEQRRLERNVREWKVKAITSKNSDPKAYSAAKKKAAEWNAAYTRFCMKNDRPIYVSRIKII